MSVKESDNGSQGLSPEKGCAVVKTRYIRLLLTGFMVSALLLGCGEEAGEKQTLESQEPPKKETSSAVTEAMLPSETILETESKAEPVTIEQQVLIDEAGIQITAQKFIEDGPWGRGVELLLENNTDRDAGVGGIALIVNNCMIDNMLLTTVPAGETITETLWLADHFLDAAGIETVGQVEVKFLIYDEETRKPLIKNAYASIPTSAYGDMEPVAPPEGTVLLDEQGFRILGSYSDTDPFYGSAVRLFAENRSDRNLNLISMHVTVNGTDVPAMCSGPVFKDKVSYYHLLIDLDKLKEQGITELEEIGIQFSFMDEDSGLMIGDPVEAVLDLKEAS